MIKFDSFMVFMHLFRWELDFSLPRPFAPGSRSLELSLPGTIAPWNFHSLELSHPGTFVPGTFQANTGWSESTHLGAKYT